MNCPNYERTPPPIEITIPREETLESNGRPAPNSGTNGKILHPVFSPDKKTSVAVKKPIFASPQMMMSFELIEKFAPSNVSVVITGETGTGKEVAADLIHELSGRKGKFIKINCAAIPRELIESEIFGSIKGSYTGSTSDRAGLIEQAEGGTFLLDELSEMPIDSQSKFLRVLQEKEYYRVGGRELLKVDCRVIAATNRSIQEAVKTGKLREDLYYRIAQVVVHLPPLRGRTEDILPLAMEFLRRLNTHIVGFTSRAIDLLTNYRWPGNVRQLENLVTCSALMAGKAELIDTCHISLPANDIGEVESDTENEDLDSIERDKIVEMLKKTKNYRLETSRRLGISRQTLYNKIKAYGITNTTFKGEPKKPRANHSYPGPRMTEDAMREAKDDLFVAAEFLEITPEQLLTKLKEYGMPIPGEESVAQGQQ